MVLVVGLLTLLVFGLLVLGCVVLANRMDQRVPLRARMDAICHNCKGSGVIKRSGALDYCDPCGGTGWINLQ